MSINIANCDKLLLCKSVPEKIILNIINYPHPTLRHPSKPLKKVDKTIRSWVEKMFELMYAAKGIGLAANQVDWPFQLFVVNTGENGLHQSCDQIPQRSG
jgi:peptide deformylase